MLFAKCLTVKHFEVCHARWQGLQTSKVFWKPTFEGFVRRPCDELTSKRLNLYSRGMLSVYAFCKTPNCQTLWGWPCPVAGAANLQGFREPTLEGFVRRLYEELTSKRLNLYSRGMVTVWAFCKMPNCQTLWGWPCPVAGAANLKGFLETNLRGFCAEAMWGANLKAFKFMFKRNGNRLCFL